MRETDTWTGKLLFLCETQECRLSSVVRFTSVAASIAHVGGNEAPLVCGWVVKLYGGEITGAVVASDHVQQPVNGTDTCRRESYTFNNQDKSIYTCSQ